MVRSVAASVLVVAALSLSACGSDSEREPKSSGSESSAALVESSAALVTACDALKAGDWTALSDASHATEIGGVSPVADDLPSIPASGTMEDWFNNTGLFGNAYADDVYQQPKPMGWTDEDMKAEAARTFGTSWATCARDVDGFPAEPDADLEQQVTEGAVKLAP